MNSLLQQVVYIAVWCVLTCCLCSCSRCQRCAGGSCRSISPIRPKCAVAVSHRTLMCACVMCAGCAWCHLVCMLVARAVRRPTAISRQQRRASLRRRHRTPTRRLQTPRVTRAWRSRCRRRRQYLLQPHSLSQRQRLRRAPLRLRRRRVARAQSRRGPIDSSCSSCSCCSRVRSGVHAFASTPQTRLYRTDLRESYNRSYDTIDFCRAIRDSEGNPINVGQQVGGGSGCLCAR
jgi:hypothetical protein